MHPRPCNLHLPAIAWRLGAEILDLAPSVGTRGSELDPDQAHRVKVWCLEEDLGQAPGDRELLSACIADPHSARALDEASPVFPEEALVPIYTNPGPPDTNRMDSLNWSVRRDPG